MGMLKIREATAYLYHMKLKNPLIASFGAMRKRVSLFIKLVDESGLHGWGEIWCNFPEDGGEHRANVFGTIFAPMLLNGDFSTPSHMSDHLLKQTRILSLQCGETGTFSHILAGIDIALWDIFAKQQNKPIYKAISDNQAVSGMVRIYASGLNPSDCIDAIKEKRKEGYANFKVKIGFGLERDCSIIESCLSELQVGESLAVDINQKYDFQEAEKILPIFGRYPIMWIEEPIQCDSSVEMWRTLSRLSKIPLAAGENVYGLGAFSALIDSGTVSILQPDVGKWGGITGCQAVGRSALKAGMKYCPHYFGGAIGQLASAHLLAGVGGDGLLEIDSNDNPFRQSVFIDFPKCKNGMLELPDAPGLGLEPALDMIAPYLLNSQSYSGRGSL